MVWSNKKFDIRISSAKSFRLHVKIEIWDQVGTADRWSAPIGENSSAEL